MLQLSLALAAPDLAGACILAGGSHYYGDELRSWWRQQAPDTVFADVERVRSLQAAHTALGPDHWRSVTAAWIDLHAHAHTEDFPEAEELRAIRTPVLIVHGDRDTLFPIEVPTGLFRLLPDAELCLLPNTGHAPPAEHPDWFNPIALDFLARRYYSGSQKD
jgi:pimeloyl-ACP methyl ester carboxylesterase